MSSCQSNSSFACLALSASVFLLVCLCPCLLVRQGGGAIAAVAETAICTRQVNLRLFYETDKEKGKERKREKERQRETVRQ